MANIRATKNGVWSDNSVWSPAPPTTVDNVFASGFTIYVDTNIQVLSINTIGATGIGGGGTFRPNNGVAMTTNVVAGSSTCVTFASASPNAFTIVGNISGGNASNAVGVSNSSTGTINISGNIIGGPGPGTFNGTNGINNTGTGIINIVGNVEAGLTNIGVNNTGAGTVNLTGVSMGSILYNGGFSSGIVNGTNGICNIIGGAMGGSNTNNYGVENGTNARTTIIGNVSAYAGSGSNGVNNGTGVILNVIGNVYGGQGVSAPGISNGTSTTNLTGNCYAYGHLSIDIRYSINGSGSNGINNTTGTVNIVGNVFGSLLRGDAWGVSQTGSGVVTISGNSYGGTVGDADGVRNSSTTGTVIISGNAIGGIGSLASGARNTTSGILRVKRAVGNDWGLGYTTAIGSTPGVLSIAAGSQTFVEELQCGSRGQWPTGGVIFFTPNSKASSMFETDTFQNYSLIQSNSADNLVPPVSSVRQGTTYNLGLSTGTCIIPPVSSVAVNTLVDNLIGTAVLTPPTTWNYPTTASHVDSMGGRLRNALNTNSANSLINSFNP